MHRCSSLQKIKKQSISPQKDKVYFLQQERTCPGLDLVRAALPYTELSEPTQQYDYTTPRRAVTSQGSCLFGAGVPKSGMPLNEGVFQTISLSSSNAKFINDY